MTSMKRLIFFITISISSYIAEAQTFAISPNDTIESTINADTFVSDFIYIENTSGDSLELSFEILNNSISTNGWGTTLCTNLGCFPNIPLSGSLGKIADGAKGFFNLHVGFYDMAGTGEVRIKVYESGNNSNTDTITFLYHAVPTTGIAENNAYPDLGVYPNPASDFIYMYETEKFNDASLKVWSLDGKVVWQENRMNIADKGIDVSSCPNGIYFLEVIKDGERCYSTKFIKQ